MTAIWIAGAVLLWSPGYLIARALRARAVDPIVALAMHIALGLAAWPVLFLWTTTIGIRWTRFGMRAAVFVTLAAALAVLGVRMRRRRPRLHFWLFFFAALAALTVVHRLAHIRDLVFPPWVDGVHHGMIVRLILEQGGVPASADPYIAGAPFFYHWGFHVPLAMVAALIGGDIPTLLLHYGQFLNALTLVTMYAGGRVLLRTREGGLFAAVLAVFVSYFPAFYLSWGRYTHLVGTLVLPPLLVALWTFARSSRKWQAGAVVVLLAAGLALIHVRVALFALFFAIVLLGAIPRAVIRWSAAAAFAVVLLSPWVVRLSREPHVAEVVEPGQQQSAPVHLLTSTQNRALLAIATAGMSGMAGALEMPREGRVLSAAWWVILIFVSRRSARSRRKPWPAIGLLAAWVALAVIALQWPPLSGLASLESAVITTFIPLALAAGALMAWALHRLVQPRHATMFACAVALAVALAGASKTHDVVNPITVFTSEADLRAMHWISLNVPAGAIFAVESRPWMSPASVGTDAGYWIAVTTGRRSILPPLLYAWSLPKEEVARINQRLVDWRNAPEATHLYLGATANRTTRHSLLHDRRLRLIHRDGGAVVFKVIRF